MTAKYPPHLSEKAAAKRLERDGPNALPEPEATSVFMVFFGQFKSPFIYVLLAAVIVSFGLGQNTNAIFILAVLILNAVIGTFQEYSAEQAARALRKMVPSFAAVIRDEEVKKIDTQDVVVGDLVMLVAGDKVPADLKLVSLHELQVDESMLTGESMAALKRLDGESDDLDGNTDRCFAGTVVMSGRAMGHVTAIGKDTEIGQIATEVEAENAKPPLLVRIEKFTLKITYTILLLIALIFVITWLRGDALGNVFLLAVALAVSAIPEGLPAAITVALAIGMRRMAKLKVIIRKLVAVEALGSCTYIASDKTGTLTVNEMTVKTVWLKNGRSLTVSGEGVDLHGEVCVEGESAPLDCCDELIRCGVLANESELLKQEEGWKARGDMVDVAFLVLAEKRGVEYKQLRAECAQLAQIPYESELAFSASVNRVDGKIILYVKGSVETLMTMLDSEEPLNEIKNQNTRLAGQGYRVLGLAYCELVEVPDDLHSALYGLQFIGMVGMIDPLRSEVFDAVASCHRANIKVAMVTGDHPQTALALARQAGIADDEMQAISGADIEHYKEQGGDAFRDAVRSTRVFARVSPHQKKQIIEQLIEDGEFVAVTGDGVNDAPALKRAHVGVAMGKRGTDVARESADIILTDDHFASIVNGITQGRIVYNNIRKVIFLLISTGAAEIMLVMLSLLFATPLPLFPLQLLWLNLVTNGIQDVALAFEPEEGDELKRPARSPGEPIFDRLMLERVITNALVMGLLAFGFFKYQLMQGVSEFEARNLTLLLMVLFENVHVLNSRSETQSIFKQYLFGNKFLLFGMLAAQSIHIGAMYMPGLSGLLDIAPVSLSQWSGLLVIALFLVLVDEIHKWWHSKRVGRRLAL